MVTVSGVKQENGGDKIELLKKVEIRFQELALLRKRFEFYKGDELLRRERERKIVALTERNEQNTRKAAEEENQRNNLWMVKIENKKNMVVQKSVRTTFRSQKPVLKNKKKKVEKISEEEQQMRRYLGIVPEEWDQGETLAAQQVAMKDAEAAVGEKANAKK